MQNASLEIIPQAGHLLNLEQPEHFNQAVERFLQSL
jgi:pimeloyl-ACP methyl ester carboxylesterase